MLPNSSRALHHLGDVLLAILDKSPSSASVEDVERYFRASIDEEGKDMNREEPSEFLKQTDFWKAHKKQCTPSQSSVVEKTAIASGVKKDEPPKGRGKGIIIVNNPHGLASICQKPYANYLKSYFSLFTCFPIVYYFML